MTLVASVSLFAGEPFRSYRKSWSAPPDLDSAEIRTITNGITLGQIVTNLGPGWISPEDSSGIIRWRFGNGRQLNVWPSYYRADEVVHTNREADVRMWFTDHPPELPVCPK